MKEAKINKETKIKNEVPPKRKIVPEEHEFTIMGGLEEEARQTRFPLRRQVSRFPSASSSLEIILSCLTIE